jgi:hypothetical protein
LRCPKTGEEFVVLWGAPPDELTGPERVLAYERTADRHGNRHVLFTNNSVRLVPRVQFRALLDERR